VLEHSKEIADLQAGANIKAKNNRSASRCEVVELLFSIKRFGVEGKTV